MQEIWKEIKGFDGHYQVSDHGRVMSNIYPTKDGVKISDTWHFLTPNYSSNNSPSVTLIKQGKRVKKYVAHLVLEAFVEKRPSKEHQAIRIDSNIKNVKRGNLKWGKRPEVSALLKHNGLMVVGEDLPQHKLTEQEVREIKDELVNGFLTLAEIAESYGVGWSCVWDIKENNNWKHVEWPEGNINDHTFKECKFCGDQFKTDRFAKHGVEKYCSDQCRKNQDKLYAAKRKSTREYKNREKLRASGNTYEEHFGTYEGTCECCGEDYEIDLSVRLEGKQPEYFSRKYCSTQCAKRQAYLNKVGKTYEEVYGTIEKDCAFCGQTFELGPDDYKGQKYCRSKACDRERERIKSAKRRWNGKGYWDREGKNDKLQRNYT